MKAIDLIMLSSEYIENTEGVILTFENKMAKQKTVFYMELHGLLTDGLKEHKLIKRILEENIDDLLAFIPAENVEERDFINELTNVIIDHTNHIATECFDIFNKDFNGDRKAFAEKYKSYKYFHYLTRLFNENTFEIIKKAVINDIIFKCRRLEMAKAYLRGLGFERELKLLEDDN